MIKKIPIKNIESDNIEIVYSEEELIYEKILNDKSDFIKILTYNISKNNEKLLKKLNSYQEVVLITNIPNRYSTYFPNATNAIKKAKEYIDNYLEKLNPKNFDCKMNVFFYFQNHSKVIIDQNTAYIGSSNFSSESSRNFECGVLIKDNNTLKSINNKIFNSIISKAIHYYGDDISKLKVLFDKFINDLLEIQKMIHYSCYDFVEHAGLKNKIFKLHDRVAFSKAFDELKFFTDEIEIRINEIVKMTEKDYIEIDISSIVKLENLRKEIEKIIINENSLSKITTFNEFDYIKDYLDKNSINVVPETLDDFRESASQKAFDIINDLEWEVQDHIKRLEELISDMLLYLDDIPEFLDKFNKNIETIIDNT